MSQVPGPTPVSSSSASSSSSSSSSSPFPTTSSPPSPFKLKAVLADTSLCDYLNGVLNTILFVRLLGLLEPLENVPLSQHSFQNTVYPVISDTSSLRHHSGDDDYLLNRSPREWVASKVEALAKSYREKTHSKRKSHPPTLADLYTKVIVVLRLYNAGHQHATGKNHTGNTAPAGKCWEAWIIDLDVLGNTETTATTTHTNINNTSVAHTIDRTTTVSTTGTAVASTGKERAKDTINLETLLRFSSMDSESRTDAMQTSFRSNMFHIIECADSNCDSIPSVRTQSLNPFLIKTEFQIKPNMYSNNKNDNDTSNNLPGELELDFNSLNISSITGDSGLSHESIEYINTTENGDVVISSGSGSGSGSKSDNDTYANKDKEDLWKNGYNFFKKMLE